MTNQHVSSCTTAVNLHLQVLTGHGSLTVCVGQCMTLRSTYNDNTPMEGKYLAHVQCFPDEAVKFLVMQGCILLVNCVFHSHGHELAHGQERSQFIPVGCKTYFSQ